ncbi:MAG: hypothetical protein LBB09_01185, partial [Rickettsiales bacterium]|nr:hypothetical protein [Rickettsiales bacterium]
TIKKIATLVWNLPLRVWSGVIEEIIRQPSTLSEIQRAEIIQAIWNNIVISLPDTMGGAFDVFIEQALRLENGDENGVIIEKIVELISTMPEDKQFAAIRSAVTKNFRHNQYDDEHRQHNIIMVTKAFIKRILLLSSEQSIIDALDDIIDQVKHMDLRDQRIVLELIFQQIEVSENEIIREMAWNMVMKHMPRLCAIQDPSSKFGSLRAIFSTIIVINYQPVESEQYMENIKNTIYPFSKENEKKTNMTREELKDKLLKYLKQLSEYDIKCLFDLFADPKQGLRFYLNSVSCPKFVGSVLGECISEVDSQMKKNVDQKRHQVEDGIRTIKEEKETEENFGEIYKLIFEVIIEDQSIPRDTKADFIIQILNEVVFELKDEDKKLKFLLDLLKKIENNNVLYEEGRVGITNDITKYVIEKSNFLKNSKDPNAIETIIKFFRSFVDVKKGIEVINNFVEICNTSSEATPDTAMATFGLINSLAPNEKERAKIVDHFVDTYKFFQGNSGFAHGKVAEAVLKYADNLPKDDKNKIINNIVARYCFSMDPDATVAATILKSIDSIEANENKFEVIKNVAEKYNFSDDNAIFIIKSILSSINFVRDENDKIEIVNKIIKKYFIYSIEEVKEQNRFILDMVETIKSLKEEKLKVEVVKAILIELDSYPNEELKNTLKNLLSVEGETMLSETSVEKEGK